MPMALHAPSASRYADQALDWRTRATGMGGTAGIFAGVAFAALFTWHAVQPIIATPAPVVMNVAQPAAPPEPAQEVPEGPQQVEQQEQKPREQQDVIEPPRIFTPPVIQAPPPVEPVQAAEPVPETTAPKPMPAPPASRAASNAELTWEALLLAHLEKYRRYPGAARARNEQGVAHVTFRMNRQGQVLSSSLSRSSGYAALDRAALETLRRAQPLPAIPDDQPDPIELSVPVEFFVGR